jgi:hypothetical protein
MVSPIVERGNVSETRYYHGVGVWYSFQGHRTTQAPPFNLVTPYTRMRATYVEGPFPPIETYGSSGINVETVAYAYGDSTARSIAANTAYDRFKSKTYANAALGVDFAESRQSLSMIRESASTIWRFTKAVRKFDLVGAARVLKLSAVPRGASKRKAWSSNWLAYHFGWEPLVRDIHDALDVLTRPEVPLVRVSGSGSFPYVQEIHTSSPSVETHKTVVCSYALRQGGTVKAITGATYHTLDQWGLLNPAVVAWELVPFSFVVDWFANVGNVLASYSDFAGMTLIDTYTSEVFRTSINGYVNGKAPYLVPGRQNLGFSADAVYMGRTLGLTAPEFSVKRLRLPSPIRALTATTLLTQLLSKR